MTDKPIDISVRRSKNVNIQINDIAAYEAFVEGRIAEATAKLQAAHDEDQIVKAELREQIAELKAKLANPETAFKEHKARESEIEQLLSDVAVSDFAGQNRIHSALEAFSDLKYEEIDALLGELQDQKISDAAKLAYGRGLVAEDAVKWHDAAKHYAQSAKYNATFESLHKARLFAWRAGDYAAALRWGQDLLDWAKASGTAEQKATAMNELALVVEAQGRYKEAEGLYREALEIDRATIGEGHPDYAIRLNNLAGVVRAQGRYEEAEGLYREALEIGRATIGEGHPNYAIGLNNLAGVVEAQGRYEEAEGLFREALDIDRATIGEEHPSYAIRLNNLALVVKAQGRYEEAEGLYREALDIDRATIGEEHPVYAVHLGNLASNFVAQGKVTEARPMFDQALTIFRATLPADHPNIATTLGHIAALPDP